MIIGLIYAALASIINLTILGNLLGSGIPIQLAVVGATVGWLYGQTRFAWTVMLVSGLLYDTLATTRFGLYIALFAAMGAVIDQAMLRRARYGTGVTIFVAAALTGTTIFTTTLIGSGITVRAMIWAMLTSALLTGGAAVLIARIAQRYEQP